MNGAGTTTKKMKADISVGAQLTAAANWGIEWTKDGGWKKTTGSGADWGFKFWEPQWKFNGEGHSKIHISPEIIIR